MSLQHSSPSLDPELEALSEKASVLKTAWALPGEIAEQKKSWAFLLYGDLIEGWDSLFR